MKTFLRDMARGKEKGWGYRRVWGGKDRALGGKDVSPVFPPRPDLFPSY